MNRHRTQKSEFLFKDREATSAILRDFSRTRKNHDSETSHAEKVFFFFKEKSAPCSWYVIRRVLFAFVPGKKTLYG
ncbi:hypothetical protein [Virgibacillus proomii]|uniref:hypothetical protein n=1 Tax=Virgibacillus proomii TaxID=84407 RepID=UPI001C127E2C|nr:hypothetical protein [Virgibacillus proomii]MBU5266451.1 hypothetical protein [Virgibacillus proomii]